MNQRLGRTLRHAATFDNRHPSQAIVAMEITLGIPDSARSAHREDRYYREALVAMLYQAGDLSSKEACEALAISRREFEEMLPRFRVSIMPDDDENIASELEA